MPLNGTNFITQSYTWEFAKNDCSHLRYYNNKTFYTYFLKQLCGTVMNSTFKKKK